MSPHRRGTPHPCRTTRQARGTGWRVGIDPVGISYAKPVDLLGRPDPPDEVTRLPPAFRDREELPVGRRQPDTQAGLGPAELLVRRTRKSEPARSDYLRWDLRVRASLDELPAPVLKERAPIGDRHRPSMDRRVPESACSSTRKPRGEPRSRNLGGPCSAYRWTNWGASSSGGSLGYAGGAVLSIRCQRMKPQFSHEYAKASSPPSSAWRVEWPSRSTQIV